jgi:hypothetical protein
LTALTILSMISSYGQRNFGIKIYQNTDIFETQYYDNDTREVTKFDNVNFSRLSLAVDIDTKKGYTHEIEFLIPEISKPFDRIQFPMNYGFGKGTRFEGKASSYSLRYEISKRLTNKTKAFSFNLGMGINPYYVHLEYIPHDATSVYRSLKSYGFALNMVPRIKYKLSNRLSLDLNVPLKIYDLRGEEFRIKSPALSRSQQTANYHNDIFFESAYTIRLGLMYQFNK